MDHMYCLFGAVFVLANIAVVTPFVPAVPGADSVVTLADPFKTRKCSYHRVFKLVSVDCSNLELKAIPTTLKSEIEILDASFNRIREIQNDTFSRYTSIKFLYLGDNMIQYIQAGAFAHLQNLEVLDISLNSLSRIPLAIFQLPYLRKLYLAENLLPDLNRELRVLPKPIGAPLQYLNLAACKLDTLPPLGVLPDLVELNVSGNHLRSLKPSDLAPLCGLKKLDLNNTNLVTEIGQCNCQLVENWLVDRNVIVTYEHTSLCWSREMGKGYRTCPEDSEANNTLSVYEKCFATIQTRKLEHEAKTTWVVVASILSGFLVIFIAILYCLHRRNVKQMENTSKPLPKEENANDESLLST